MSTYFFMIFEVHYIVFGYDVCLEEYMDLSPRLISGTKSEDKEPMRWTKRSGSQKKKKKGIIISHTFLTDFATESFSMWYGHGPLVT